MLEDESEIRGGIEEFFVDRQSGVEIGDEQPGVGLQYLHIDRRILEEISAGRGRLREVHRAVEGISYKMLTQTLRELESHGVVARYDHHTANPRVDYTLTEAGAALVQTVHTLCGWSRAYLDRLLDAPGYRLATGGASD